MSGKDGKSSLGKFKNKLLDLVTTHPVTADIDGQKIFSEIYRKGAWGADSRGKFYSGFGSHKDTIVDPYVQAVSGFISELQQEVTVLDLGCGDFNVGRQIRPVCGTYVACDVVPDLIESNKVDYSTLGVDFRVLDIVKDDLPEADVVFIRQVLQHLNNAQIAKVVKKLGRFKWVVITEHLPEGESFTPNREKPAGANIRLEQKPPSGVVLTEAPFTLLPRSERVICDVRDYGGSIKTTVYEML